MDLAALLEEFKTESFEHLEKLESGLLALERDPGNSELIRKLFMSAHTIKGGASMLELQALKGLTHAFEDVLARLRGGTDQADPATISLLLRASDEIRQLVEHDPARATPSPETSAVTEALQRRARGEAPPKSAENPQPVALILEPTDTARLLLRLQLEARGWQVIEAPDEAAVQQLVSQASLVVLPLEPGGINGLELALKLRAQRPELQLALSALEFSQPQREQAQRLGADCVRLSSWRENPWSTA